MDARNVVFIISANKIPVVDADLALVAHDGTYLSGRTNGEGIATISTPYDGEARTILVAHPAHQGYVASDHVLGDENKIAMTKHRMDASVLFLEGAGNIPGLQGRLNPILDPLGRTYIYGNNISFNSLPDQPFSFRVDESFTGTDAMRNRFSIVVKAIIGRTSLLDYKRL